jgi:hypothetical protein
VSCYEVAQRQDLRDERDAQVGRQEGGDGPVDRLGVIRCVCAFTNMNAVSVKDLTGVVQPMKSVQATDEIRTRVAHEGGGALGNRSRTKRGSAGGLRHASGA